jgi:transcriptional regulator of arginine metabolism
MSDKSARQQAIRTLVTARPIASQEALQRLLARAGWTVTQSTLSRDLRELRIARIPGAGGRVRYGFPDGQAADAGLGRLERMLPQLLVSVEGVEALVVARTVKSGAQPVAEALDHLAWPDVAGTIAGDDTVLIICRSRAGRDRVVKRLRAYRPR